MNKIEQMHLDTMIVKDLQSAVRSAEITEQFAIEFAEWCNAPNLEDLRQGNVVYVPSGNFYWHKHNKYTLKELFQQFLKTKEK